MRLSFLFRCFGVVPAARSVHCGICGGSVRGRLDNIALSILCSSCCQRATQPYVPATGRYYTLPEMEALGVCGLSEEDVRNLQFSVARAKNRTAVGDTVRFFLRGEIRYLRNVKRKKELERITGLRIDEIEQRLRGEILGDYLSETAHEETTLAQVQARCAVASRINAIARRCPSEDPAAIVEFCLQHEAGLDRSFEEIRAKACQVFRLEGHRIMQAFWEMSNRDMISGPLNDIRANVSERDQGSTMRVYLRRWFDDDLAEEILEQYRAAWTGEPKKETNSLLALWTTEGLEKVALGLTRFERARTIRKNGLEEALRQKGLTLPDGSPVIERYLNGLGSRDLAEVVAIVHLWDRLQKDHCVMPNSPTAVCAVNRMIQYLRIEDLSQDVAVYLSIKDACPGLDSEPLLHDDQF